MNILTFDIEEWYLEKHNHNNRSEKYKEFDQYLENILTILDERHLKGTFFCVGGMAREFPEVVRRIAEAGHEIGCHSNTHTWLNKMTQQECLEDTRAAVDSLEQCIGQKIKSYRAPAFSIGENNKWAFEVLAECGIERDASVFPAARDFGGFPHFGHKTPTLVRYNGIEIKEFPCCTTTLLGKELAYSGGGYFRFFPLWYVEKEMAKGEYSMTYFHIADLIPETNGVMSREDYEAYFKEPGTLLNRYKRFIKGNLGKKGAMKKLSSLLHSHDFVNLEEADKMIEWEKVEKMEICRGMLG